MAAITVRNLPPEVHRALKARARQKGRSTEAEVRAILQEAVHSPSRTKIGSALAEFAKSVGGLDLEIPRDATAAEPTRFE
jgi:antitoxin FitA